MASRPGANGQLLEPSYREVPDIHVVAEILGNQRSNTNNLIVEQETGFPVPIYELMGKRSHPLRLCWRDEIEIWKINGERIRED